MNSTTIGNTIHPHGPLSGSGRAGMRTPFGRVAVTGKVGEVKMIPINDLVSTNGPGLTFLAQAVGGDVAIATTLAPPDLALHPAQSAVWVNSTAVAAGGIVQLPFVGSAYRITFTAAATVYIMGV